MSSSNLTEFSADEQGVLLTLASNAIEQGLVGKKDIPESEKYNSPLSAQGASFVTLKCDGKLRGCIGTLDAHQSLVVDVAKNAWSAAFSDRRFLPLTANEFPRIKIHISVLTPATPVTFTSEQNLIEQLRPGIDGLILSLGQQRGTFLPSVWKALPDPVEFLQHLKKKAGLQTDFWSDDIRIQRYRTISIAH